MQDFISNQKAFFAQSDICTSYLHTAQAHVYTESHKWKTIRLKNKPAPPTVNPSREFHMDSFLKYIHNEWQLPGTNLYLSWDSTSCCRDTAWKAIRKLENDNDFLFNLIGDHLCGAKCPCTSGKNSCSFFSDFPILRKCSLLNKIIPVTGKSIQCRLTFKLRVY